MGGGEGASQATFDECAGGNSRDGGGWGGGVALSNGDYGFGAFGSISCMLIGHLHDDAI